MSEPSLKRRFSKSDVELVSKTSAYDGLFKIKQYIIKHRLFAGGWSGEVKRELFERDPAVGVIVYDPSLDAVILVEQFRIGAYAAGREPWNIELIAGIVEPNEAVEEVARREALEEAGVNIEQLEPIAEYSSSPGGSNEVLSLFCGKADLSNAGGNYGVEYENEDIRATVVSFDDAIELLTTGKIGNAHTIIGLQWLQLNRQRLRDVWLP